MPRYIDADALYRETEKAIAESHQARMAVVDDEFLDLINDAYVDEDVVEVVRCHEGDMGVHGDREFDIALKRTAQRHAMDRYGWSVLEFRSRFRNNYLDEEDIGDESAGGM